MATAKMYIRQYLRTDVMFNASSVIFDVCNRITGKVDQWELFGHLVSTGSA